MGMAIDPAGAAIDPRTGVAIPQRPVTIRGRGLRVPQWRGVGTITYLCFTCGEKIVKHWETFFVDLAPANAWASYLEPPKVHPTLTTHHDWHMAASQDGSA